MFDVLYERPHLHIKRNRNNAVNAKIWLDDLSFADTGDFIKKELNQIQKVVAKNITILSLRFEDVKKGTRQKPIDLS